MHQYFLGLNAPRIRFSLALSLALVSAGIGLWHSSGSYAQDAVQLRRTPAAMPAAEPDNPRTRGHKSPFNRPQSEPLATDKTSEKAAGATFPAVQTGDSSLDAAPDATSDVGFPPPSGLETKILEDRLKNAESRRQTPTRVPSLSTRLNTSKLDDIIRQGKGSLENEYTRADALLARYQFSEAIEVLRDIRKVHGAQADTLTLFGEYCLQKGLPDLAEETFRLASQRQTAAITQTKADWAQNEARTARRKSDEQVAQAESLGRKNLEEALKSGEEALRWNQLNANAHRVLGQLYEKRRDWGRAADHDFAFMKLAPAEANRLKIGKRIEYLKQELRQALSD